MGAHLIEAARARERAGNCAVQTLWERYAAHRARMTATIEALAPGGRLALLGAGNCLDVDLGRLAQRFQEIHLVDLDGAALAGAIGRQPPEVRRRLQAHVVELSGLLGAEARAEVAAARVAAALPRGLDAVASCCVLTQLAFAVAGARPGRIPGEPERTVAAAHLRLLAALVRSGGAALLATELASSDEHDLDGAAVDAALVRRLLSTGAFYTVADPRLLQRLLREAPGACAVELGAPWLWDGALERTYLVQPLRFARA